MAGQFQAGSCSSTGSWWSMATTAGGGGGGGLELGPAMSASVSCSTELTDVGGSFNWAPPNTTDVFDAKSSRSCDESPVSISNSSITFQEIQSTHVSAPMITAPMLAMDFGLSSPTMDWSQPFFSGRAEHSFHALLQLDQPDLGIESNQIRMGVENSSSLNPLKNINSIAHLSAPGGSTSALLQGLLEPDSRLQRSFYEAQPMTYKSSSIDYCEQQNESSLLQPSSLVKLPHFVKALSPKQQQKFSNSLPFSSVTDQAHSNFHHGRPPQLFQNENSSHCCNLTVKSNLRADGSSSTLGKKSGSEPAFKKARIEKPSPLPTFKVRKEKLGDRITALQQLVSPFGKTDTASVLHEAIEYIKFLHDQVRVSSAPYLKNGHQKQQVKGLEKSKDCEGHIQDLKSRGLCLVPISSTYAVANEIPTDFWTPTFVGTFR